MDWDLPREAEMRSFRRNRSTLWKIIPTIFLDNFKLLHAGKTFHDKGLVKAKKFVFVTACIGLEKVSPSAETIGSHRSRIVY